MDNVSSLNMVKIFSDGITKCVAPRDIADRFFNELTEFERKETVRCFVDYQDSFVSGKVRGGFDGSNRGIIIGWFQHVETRADGKSILCRIVTLEIDDWDA